MHDLRLVLADEGVNGLTIQNKIVQPDGLFVRLILSQD